ncbi:hypothetical protein EDB85DRAFT_983118 [Lactarius pseudohatsudake]|nr:hypothetical protein EDB85DRAFT_983118 [Lactarius pseudohatsudake]
MRSPHEILIQDVRVDLFGGHWAQRAADISVALDLVLPVPHVTAASHAVPPPPLKIGHNLYDKRYTFPRLPIPCTYVPLRNGVTHGRRIPRGRGASRAHTHALHARICASSSSHTRCRRIHFSRCTNLQYSTHFLRACDASSLSGRSSFQKRSRGPSKLTMRSLGCRI